MSGKGREGEGKGGDYEVSCCVISLLALEGLQVVSGTEHGSSTIGRGYRTSGIKCLPDNPYTHPSSSTITERGRSLCETLGQVISLCIRSPSPSFVHRERPRGPCWLTIWRFKSTVWKRMVGRERTQTTIGVHLRRLGNRRWSKALCWSQSRFGR